GNPRYDTSALPPIRAWRAILLRAAEEVSLDVLTAESEHARKLLVGLDALGYDGHLEVVTQARDAADDDPFHRRGLDSPHERHIELDDFGLEVRAQGSASDLERELTTLVAQNRARFAGTATSPSHLSLVGARLVWEDGDRQRVSASDIGLEIDSRGNGVEDVRGNVGRFDITTKNANFGPWASSFERTPQGARLRVVFDPPVPDGPSALVVWTRAMPTEVTVKIPRSPFKNLGIRPVDVGLSASETTDVELELKGKLADEARSEITGRGAVWGLRPKGFATAIDVHVEGGATRLPGKPFELEKTSVTLGPFAAGVTGTVTPHDLGFRLDAMFRTAPIPCERIARAEAKNAGPLAAALQALGQSTGIIRVIGTVNASGVVKYDTAAPGDATLTWLAKETCGVSIFGK
ncbi:MAG TPA: hypothetical protein VM580_26205, partial [Labilithrix sp.]|nr:hypothetical protein [Labilithrix sp.]